MTTLLITFNGTQENGQFLGDQICSLKMAWLFAQNVKPNKILLSMSPGNEMHFLWQRFIDKYNVEVVYDTWNPGDMPTRWEHWNQWRQERSVEGRKFEVYKELYRRIDGGFRQPMLCGEEAGLRRKNIFEYFYYGQETVETNTEGKIEGIEYFDDSVIYYTPSPSERDVYIAPHAKCQGNHVFTFDFWSRVVYQLMNAGVSVTVGYNGNFCEELLGNPLYRKFFRDFKSLVSEVTRHKLVACGNTGVGWVAGATNTPLLAMQPPNSIMADYRYEQCGVKSLVEIVDTPDADYVARRIVEEVNRVVVMTTGCYDVLHAGHVRHLEASRSMGTKLIVALNSDASVKRLKGEDRPINSQEQRQAVLQALRCVDEVRVFDGDDAIPLIKAMKPNILTNGFGHEFDKIVGKELVEQYGGRVSITTKDGKFTDLSTTKVARVIRQSDVLKAIQDASGVSLNPFGKLKLLADQFLTVVGLPGAMADVGAYRGGCSLILRRLAPNRELHLFDTWSGNPFNDDLCHHKKGEWPAELSECQKIVGKPDEKTVYWPGVFPSCMDVEKFGFDVKFCFVVIDPDTYQTTRDAIEFFWPRLVQGGKLFFDDYDWEPCAGVKKAVDEAFPENQRTVFAQNFTCVVTKR